MSPGRESDGLIPRNKLLRRYLLNPYDLREIVKAGIVTEVVKEGNRLYYVERDIEKLEKAILAHNEDPDKMWSEVAKEISKQEPNKPIRG